jgi:hypothetical protein
MKQIVALVIILLLVPLTTSAQDFCEGNFDYDDDQDGTDAFTFKTDFGRSLLKNPCPPDGPAPASKTGQALCYDQIDQETSCAGTGQDGELQKGVDWPNSRFTANVDNNGDGDCLDAGEPCDGTVTDNLTGLIWLRDANCSLFNAPRTWYDALNIIVPQLADGYCQLEDGSSPGDWRLPNVKELQSLIDFGEASPSLPSDHPFTNVSFFSYWSSTSYDFDPGFAWRVDMGDGKVDGDLKPYGNYVWPVRGGH